jgi:hypothetical protein
MGLEILRNVPLIQGACRAGLRPRLWTFHPQAFDDHVVDLVPLQQGIDPLFPAENGRVRGVFWMPHAHPQGPYVCRRTLAEGAARGFRPLRDADVDVTKPGCYPAWLSEQVAALFADDPPQAADLSCPLYPSDAMDEGEMPPVVINLVGAHGTEKGISDARAVAEVGSIIGRMFPHRRFVFLLHARVCAGQSVQCMQENVRLLVHLDCDPRVARLLHPNAPVITVEGGLAHSALYRGCQLTLIGLADWLRQTAYLYPAPDKFDIETLPSFAVDELCEAINRALKRK